jgi:hypothetical protein
MDTQALVAQQQIAQAEQQGPGARARWFKRC